MIYSRAGLLQGPMYLVNFKDYVMENMMTKIFT